MTRTRSTTASETSAAKRQKVEEFSVGDKIPDVTLKDQDGNEHNLGEIKGLLVLFSFPKANTPGCTNQSRGFGELYDQFKELGATVFGLSADSEKARTAFRSKLGLEFDLLSDPDYELLKKLGASTPKKKIVRSHWVFLDGVCKLAEHNVKPAESPKASLAAAKEAIGASAGTADGAPEESKEAQDGNGKPANGELSESIPDSDSKPDGAKEEAEEAKEETEEESKEESKEEPEESESKEAGEEKETNGTESNEAATEPLLADDPKLESEQLIADEPKPTETTNGNDVPEANTAESSEVADSKSESA